MAEPKTSRYLSYSFFSRRLRRPRAGSPSASRRGHGEALRRGRTRSAFLTASIHLTPLWRPRNDTDSALRARFPIRLADLEVDQNSEDRDQAAGEHEAVPAEAVQIGRASWRGRV